MTAAGVKNRKAEQPIVRVVYSKNGINVLKEAYRLLVKKMQEAKKCERQSMSE